MHRPTVWRSVPRLFVVAIALLPRLGFELMPQTDEGEVNVDAELPVGTRIERTEAVLLRLEDMVRQSVPEMPDIITNAGGGGGGGGFGGGGTHRANINIRSVPKDERETFQRGHRDDLRRRLSGMPGVIVRARASGGNFQFGRFLGAAAATRLALEIRGHDLADANRLANEAKSVMDDTPGVADVRIGRDEGRPELAVRIDRAKAALLGMSQSGWPTPSARISAERRRRSSASAATSTRSW